MAFDFDKAVSLRNEGRTLKDIATILDVSHGYVRAKLSGVSKGKLDDNSDVVKEMQRIRNELKALEDLLLSRV